MPKSLKILKVYSNYPRFEREENREAVGEGGYDSNRLTAVLDDLKLMKKLQKATKSRSEQKGDLQTTSFILSIYILGIN